MSQSHVTELYEALTHRGWKVLEYPREHEGVQGCVAWEIWRGEAGARWWIDFAGFGGLGEDIGLDDSGYCKVRDRNSHLYFYRVKGSRWKAELRAFINALESLVQTDRASN